MNVENKLDDLNSRVDEITSSLSRVKIRLDNCVNQKLCLNCASLSSRTTSVTMVTAGNSVIHGYTSKAAESHLAGIKLNGEIPGIEVATNNAISDVNSTSCNNVKMDHCDVENYNGLKDIEVNSRIAKTTGDISGDNIVIAGKDNVEQVNVERENGLEDADVNGHIASITGNITGGDIEIGEKSKEMAVTRSIHVTAPNTDTSVITPAKWTQYDAMLVHAAADHKESALIKYAIEKFILLKDGTSPTIMLWDLSNQNLTEFDRMVERCTYLFILVTEDISEHFDALDQCATTFRDNPDHQYCLVPIFSQKIFSFKLPFGLRALKGIDLTTLFKGRPYQEYRDINLSQLSLQNLDSFLLKTLKHLFDSRIDKKSRTLCDKRM